jgi:hypothetical protein
LYACFPALSTKKANVSKKSVDSLPDACNDSVIEAREGEHESKGCSRESPQAGAANGKLK